MSKSWRDASPEEWDAARYKLTNDCRICWCGKADCRANYPDPTNKPLIETIDELAIYLGIGNLEYMHVGIKQAREYGYEATAQWLEEVEAKLRGYIESEWNVADPKITPDTTGL